MKNFLVRTEVRERGAIGTFSWLNATIRAYTARGAQAIQRTKLKAQAFETRGMTCEVQA